MTRALVAAFACMLAASVLGLVPGTNRSDGVASADPASPVSSRYGVCDPHLKWHDSATQDRILSDEATAGIGWIRIDFAWPDVEPTRGAWNFNLTDAAVAKAQQRGIKILGILGFSPSWANGGCFFFGTPPTDMAAWQNYVSTVCARYKGKVSAWEVWNEENILSFWITGPNPNAYVQLVALAAPRIRAADPAATVVMGGVAGLDPVYIDGCLKAGIANYVDAVAYHPYPVVLTCSVLPQEPNCRYIISWLRNLIAQYTTKHLQIWLTELGWTAFTGYPGVDRDTQAAYLLRTFINYADQPIDQIFWYNLWDEQSNPQDSESNYGLLANDFTRKPSYNTFKVFQGLFGHVTSAAPGSAAFSCATPATLEAHSFNMDDGSLLVTSWKSDDNNDSLTLTVNSASYLEPVVVDPVTGVEQAASGVSRGSDLKVTVAGLAVGKRPVILKFAPLTQPRLATLTPSTGGKGAEVAITGAGFGPVRGASTVSFGSLPAAQYTSWSSDQVKCRAPDQTAGKVRVQVTTPGGSSNTAVFTLTSGGPVVTSMAPAMGTERTTVKVTNLAGTDFATGATVSLSRSGSTIAATSVNVVSSTKITCSLTFQPGTAGSYDIVVRNPNGQEGRLTGGFTVSMSQCGAGAAPAMMAAGLVMGLLTVAGFVPLRKKLGRRVK